MSALASYARVMVNPRCPQRAARALSCAGTRRRQLLGLAVHQRVIRSLLRSRTPQKDSPPMTRYRDFHRRSIEAPEDFWRDEARRIHWETPFDTVLDRSNPPFARWFVGGRTNLCHNAVDRHLAERAQQDALVYVSTETGIERRYTYAELYAEVNRMAAVMRSLGVKRGDRVLIYLPMIPEAAFAMLACARLGAIHSVVFGGFAAPEPRGAHRRRETRR